MNYSKRAYVALFAAVAAAPFFARPAAAQMRVDTAGHALDANPQVGSGGYNSQSGVSQQNQYQYQNSVATENIRNGFGFRGANVNGVDLGVGYTDPFAFRGLLAGEGVDQFIAGSTGVPTMANPSASSQNFAAPPSSQLQFYGGSNHVSAPAGFQPSTNSPGYIPQQPMTVSPQDSRLGAIDFSGNSVIIPKPYEMILPGPVDPTANPATPSQQMLAANPLFGVVNWTMTPNIATPGQPTQANSPFGQSPLQQGITPQIAQGLTVSQLAALRQQVAGQNMANQNLNVNPALTDNSLAPLRPGGVTADNGQPLSPLGYQSQQLTSNNLSPTAGNVSTYQSSRQTLDNNIPLPPPGQQSTQYAKLQQSLQDYNSGHAMTDEQANQKFRQIQRLRALANQRAEMGGASVLTGPGAPAAGTGNDLNPGGVPSPDQELNVPVQPDLSNSGSRSQFQPGFKTLPNNLGGSPDMGQIPASPAPQTIDSFASGIKSKGLADLIASGELAIQKGQYDRAIADYDQAIQVVPNNPLILAARATAELGGGYYAQANSDLHLAISEDPAVLMGQYDLQKHLGAQRLKSLISDLKDISTHSKDDTIHSFLLAFTYYNSHHVGQAADWLQITDERSHGQDPAIIQMKKYWNFNDEAPVPQPAPDIKPAPSPKPSTFKPSTQPSKTK